MAITKMEDSRTFAMLSKDARVASIRAVLPDKVQIVTANGWLFPGSPGNPPTTTLEFSDWESARNAVRKAVQP